MKPLCANTVAAILVELGASFEGADRAASIYARMASGRIPDERMDRQVAVSKARTLFVKTGITRNIGTAFGLYQRYFANTERPVTVTTRAAGRCPQTMLKRLRRTCPDCGRWMRVGAVNTCAATRIGGAWRSVWVCDIQRGGCGRCDYSKLDLAEWRLRFDGEGAA